MLKISAHAEKWQHMRVHAQMATFNELYFLGGSKNLCPVQAALEQITLFDLLDFGLLLRRRRSGTDTFHHHVEQQVK